VARVWEASPAAESSGEWVKKRETKAADSSREEGTGE